MARIDPQMSLAVDIVRSNPGCTKLFVARWLHIGARLGTNNALGYEPVNRAIRAGLIRATQSDGRYSLNVAE